jgi:triacylglycerol lipase
MKKHICIYIFTYLLLISTSMANTSNCVILLHGLGRSHHSMSSLETTLKQSNYVVINRSYPTTKLSIKELAESYIQPMVTDCLNSNPDKIMFITHSLGGLVLEKFLENNTIPNLSHVVMLSPPHHGSPLADALFKNWLYKFVMGPAGQELITKNKHITSSIQQAEKFGIIAGNYNLIPFTNAFFHEENDGKVSISSAKTTEMTDFIILPVSHTFMMKNKFTKKQILYFLKYGKFDHKSGTNLG